MPLQVLYHLGVQHIMGRSDDGRVLTCEDTDGEDDDDSEQDPAGKAQAGALTLAHPEHLPIHLRAAKAPPLEDIHSHEQS